MKLQFFCPRWGSENINWLTFLTKIKVAGYDGVEWAIAGNTSSYLIDDIQNLAQQNGLLLIAQHYDTVHADFNLHYDTYAAWFEKVNRYSWLKINSQTGRDYFSVEQNKALIELAGESVIHETHRGKFSFAAHVTQLYLEQLPELKITLDASHWVNVAESFLEDQAAAMEMAISRTEHIHARVGYPEGPQISDPGLPEWKEALNHHLRWWDQVVARKQNEGPNTIVTITPEFGPYPYMVQLPHTRQPIANQWEVNLNMMNLLKERYA